MVSCLAEVPAHIQAGWSTEERRYYEHSYDKVRLGTAWTIAHRKIEMQMSGRGKRNFFLGYWPREALDTLERFREHHYDAELTTGAYSPHPIADRVKYFFPELFDKLGCRLEGLSDAENSHPWLREYSRAYQQLKNKYFELLTSSDSLTKHLGSKSLRYAKRHEYYRVAFEAVYPDLHALLKELSSLCACRPNLQV